MLFLGLTDYDEGAFASTSLQMIKDNQFFIPYLGEELRLEKPIFAYWVQALSIYTFGANEFALTTFGVSAGKWYAEVYLVAITSLQRTVVAITGDADGTIEANTNIGSLIVFINVL